MWNTEKIKALSEDINLQLFLSVKKSIEELYFYYKKNEDKIKKDILTQMEDTFKLKVMIFQSFSK